MNLREMARAALAALPRSSQEAGPPLLQGRREGSLTFRIDDGERTSTVVWELDASGGRLACTCGKPGCEHAAALLAALAGGELSPDLTEPEPGAAEIGAAEPTAGKPPAEPGATAQEIAEAADELIRQICALGLGPDQPERDASLEGLVSLLRERDLPDLKRAVALLRRVLTSPDGPPDPSRAATALMQISTLKERLRQGKPLAEPRRPAPVAADFQRKEEVRLLEVARDTQRTPFGERRDVSYFLDLDDNLLLREEASAPPGSAPRMSEGPFPKLLLGNLILVEAGPSPQRVRLLQYASAGFASETDLEHLLASSHSDVATLYRGFRTSSDADERGPDHLVIFSPDRVLPSSSGIVLADENGALLPLARAVAPALCATVDLLDKRGTLLAVIGPLVLSVDLLALHPLSVVIELDGTRTLRRLR